VSATAPASESERRRLRPPRGVADCRPYRLGPDRGNLIPVWRCLSLRCLLPPTHNAGMRAEKLHLDRAIMASSAHELSYAPVHWITNPCASINQPARALALGTDRPAPPSSWNRRASQVGELAPDSETWTRTVTWCSRNARAPAASESRLQVGLCLPFKNLKHSNFCSNRSDSRTHLYIYPHCLPSIFNLVMDIECVLTNAGNSKWFSRSSWRNIRLGCLR
jgi:hypothetical protein